LRSSSTSAGDTNPRDATNLRVKALSAASLGCARGISPARNASSASAGAFSSCAKVVCAAMQ
jgi:hypothetical protein